MYRYRVTKYNPSERDEGGAFLREDWTSVSDVGRFIGGTTITKSQYLEMENRYVEAAMRLLSFAGIHAMRVMNLELKTEGADTRLDDDGLVERCARMRDNMLVAGKNLEDVIRGCLREYIWCRLVGTKGSYLHFGYDYYMYVGLPKSASAILLPPGIFAEEFDSPYLTIDD